MIFFLPHFFFPKQARICGTCWLSAAAQVDIFCSPSLFNNTQLYSGSLIKSSLYHLEIHNTVKNVDLESMHWLMMWFKAYFIYCMLMVIKVGLDFGALDKRLRGLPSLAMKLPDI